MFEVLVYMFEHYINSPINPQANLHIDTRYRPDDDTLSRELYAAGFDEDDISGAFDWFNQLERMSDQPDVFANASQSNTRIFTDLELSKISGESIGFILFLVQANILNTAQRELVLELAMNLPQLKINIEEMRWIVLMTTWGASKSGPDKTKEYLFIEDVLMNKQKQTLH